MFDGKLIKNILMGLGLVFLILGQVLLLNGGRLPVAVVLMVLCVILFALALTEKYTVITSLIQNAAVFFARMAAKPAEKTKGPAVKGAAKKVMIMPPQEKITPQMLGGKIASFFRGIVNNEQGFSIKIFVPKWVLFAAMAVLFVIMQFFFFKQELKMAIFVLICDILLLVAGIMMKDGFHIEFGLESGLKILSFIAGAVLVVMGWLMLINYSITTQELGVALTIPGTILLFLSLPKTSTEPLPDPGRTNILFLKPEFLNNYVAKGIMLIAAFISLKIGIRVMQSPDYNLYSMIFYAISGALVFFSFPLFNFPEKQYDSRLLDFIKLGVVLAALAIAYRGQTFFVKNDINHALTHYFIAGILFIFAFPVYAGNTPVEHEPFPVKLEIILLVLIVAAGVFLRLYEIDVRPFGIENDEAGAGIHRFDIHGNPDMPYSVGNFGLPMHIVQLFIALLGGLNRLSLKMLGVSVGILSLPMLYFLIRAAVGPRAAIFTAALYTVLRWNVYYGRYGCGYIYSNAMEIGMLYFIIQASKTRNKFIWGVLGLCVGLAWHGVMTTFLLIFPVLIYFGIKALSEKKYLKLNIIPLIAFFLGFWIFGSMIVHNYFISRNIYFSRVGEVSVFSNDPNAPTKNVAKGIVYNAQTVLMMFNHMGDSRSRNSGGQPYEPTVDFLTSMFFAIGFLYALYYSKYYVFFIMIMVFFSQAAGSIFSIEAPSAMRAIGTMFPMLFFIAIVFDKIWLAFRKAFGKRFELLYTPLLLLVFLVPIAKENYNQYFNRWVGGMDELSTAAGMYAQELGKKTWILLYTGLYYPGHPPFKFFRDGKANSGPIFVRGLVWLKEVTDEDFAVFFHYDTWANMDSIKNALFPDSKVTVVDHHYLNHKVKPGEGLGTFVKSLDITNAQIQKMRGLTGAYSFGGPARENEEPVFLKDDGARAPYKASWKGLILIPYYGAFRFSNRGNARFSVAIDGNAVPQGGEVILAEGFHKITVTGYRNSAQDSLDLDMGCKHFSGGRNIGALETIHISKRYLYNLKSLGLHGYFYKGEGWTDSPISEEIININMCLSGGAIAGMSAVWKGNITAPAADDYRFYTNCNGYTRIVIDGKYYFEQPRSSGDAADKIEKYFKARKLTPVNDFKLTAGKHAIEIYCANASLFELQWDRGASHSPAPIPVDALEPDYQISKN